MLLSRFLRNRDAGVAPMLALAALPLFGFAGAAVDFSRAASVRTSMQAALDASALIMAKSAKNADATVLNADATQYFNANFQNSEIQNLNTSAATSSTSNGYSATLTASGSIKSKFMGMI